MMFLLSLCAICAVSGCAAFSSRIIGNGYFQGVRCDYNEMFYPETIDTQCRINPALAAVDMPFSFVVDILFVPIDIYCGCEKSSKPKLFAPDFHALGFEDAKDARAHFESYKQVFTVRISEDRWEDRGTNKYAIHHFKATVAKNYKGDWRAGELIAFARVVDAPALTTTNAFAGSCMLVLTDEHANREIPLDRGDFLTCNTNLEQVLKAVFADSNLR